MRHSSIDMTLKHYTHLGLTDTGWAVEKLPDFQSLLNVNRAVKTGTDGMEAIRSLPGVIEKSPEIGHVSQSFVGISCPQKTSTSKQIVDNVSAQVVTNDRVDSICLQKTHCPELESNQHDPKVTSPSS